MYIIVFLDGFSHAGQGRHFEQKRPKDWRESGSFSRRSRLSAANAGGLTQLSSGLNHGGGTMSVHV